MEQCILEKSEVIQHNKKFPRFYEFDGPLLYSQKPALSVA